MRICNIYVQLPVIASMAQHTWMHNGHAVIGYLGYCQLFQ